ncbi:uncharacterized protein LOC117508553 isoform X2 [Thalassophryne amazonica]|uniref:uncharacterized protein LOC117508553 isoform X2 n=1 Tax=Thalassophryne amazonica TaxID=390379 RepID=UPI0014725FF0|nr:uncharacterized protein LOC117508553 isoform X2 [Thalassophryne amazonica]
MGPHHRKQRSVVVKAESMDHSGVCPPDVQQVLVIKEEVPIEQDEWDPSLDHDDSNPLYIKEEEEEFCISQEGEQHEGLEEDNSMFPFDPLTRGHNEAVPQFSQLHQSQSTEHLRERVPQAICSANDIKTEANGMDGYESEPDSHLNQDDCLSLDPGNKPIYISETESDEDDEIRKRVRKSQSPFWEKNGIPIYKVTMMPLSQLQPLVSGKGKGPCHISSPGLSADMSRQTFTRAGVPNVTHFQPLASGKPKASHQIGSPGFSADFTCQSVAVQRAGVFKPSHIAGSSVTPGSAVTPQNLQPVGWLYGDPVYAIGAGGFTPPYSAALPKNASMSVKQTPESKRKKEDKPYIKKPPNSFMLFMKEQRQNIVAECNVKESATVNQILGMKWKAMSDEEQAKYYELAQKERILHSQMYPDWSPSDNYAKKKKRTRVKPVFVMEAHGEDPSQPKRLCVLPGSEGTLQPQTVVFMPSTQTATLKSQPQTLVLQQTVQNATVKPQPQAVMLQPTMQNATVKPQPQPIVLQTTAQNAAGKLKPQTFVLQPTAQTVAGNPQMQSSAIKPQMQSVALNPHTQTAGVNPQTQTVVLQPHTQTVVLQPHTQTVVLQHQTSASTTAMLQTNNIIPPPQQRQIEQKPYIKKPPNAFMLFMREQRPNVVAQYNMKESATVNQILGQKWNALTREEQAKYFELARQEKIIHSQLYPDWSPNANPKRRRRVKVETYSRTEVPVPAFADESSQPKMPPVLSGSDRMPHTQTVVIEPHTQALVFKPHTQPVVLKLGTQSVVMQPHNVSTHKQINVNQETSASIVDSIETSVSH